MFPPPTLEHLFWTAIAFLGIWMMAFAWFALTLPGAKDWLKEWFKDWD